MSTELAIVDVATEIERSADPGAFIILACERAKSWLTQALAHGDLDQLIEIKSQAEAIRVYTASKELGHDAELSAQEIVRRAERGLAIAVTRGQDEGTVAKGSGGDRKSNVPAGHLISAREIFGAGRAETESKLMASVDDDTFDAGIEEAKEAGDLSRKNVLRKIGKPRDDKGAARSEDADEAPPRAKDSPNYKKRHLKADRMVAEVCTQLEGVCSVLNEAKVSTLTPENIEEWATSLTKSVSRINRFIKEMTRVSN